MIVLDDIKQIIWNSDEKSFFKIIFFLGFCGWFHDSIVCWPPTPAGSKAYHACADIQDLQEPCHTGKAFR